MTVWVSHWQRERLCPEILSPLPGCLQGCWKHPKTQAAPSNPFLSALKVIISLNTTQNALIRARDRNVSHFKPINKSKSPKSCGVEVPISFEAEQG